MKWKYILSVICIMFVDFTTYSSIQQVSLEEAQKAAWAIMGRNANAHLLSASTNGIKTVNQLTESEHALMYEVVFEDNSAVLLSGSKACLPVLGYYTVSEETPSAFDNEAPGGLKDLLEVYRRQIEDCFQNDTISLYYQNEWQELQTTEKQILSNSSSRASVVVPPLLSTTWGQSWSNNEYENDIDFNAYNYYVDEDSKKCDSRYSSRCPAGCTSVAMAQIMRYWEYPVYYAPALGGIYWFDWCNMPDKLDTHSPNYEKERNAIAALIKSAGVAAQTNYCYAGGCQSMASIWNARKALEDFGYDTKAHVDWRAAHSENNWIQKIKNDLNNGRPVMYSALDITETAGHTFIIDGYDSDNKFHINWGWRGSSDGYYSINTLAPRGDGKDEYTSAEHALFELYPKYDQSICDFELSLYDHYQQAFNTIAYMIFSGVPLPESIADDTKKSYPQTATRLISGGQNVTFLDQPMPELYVIPSGETYEYVAHEAIILKPGFHAQAGANFTARIEPCAECGNSRIRTKQTDHLTLKHSTKAQVSQDVTIQTKKEVILLPNPTQGQLTVQSTKEINRIELYNLNGEKVSENRETTLDLHPLPDGMYIVVVRLADGTIHSEKVAKCK